MNLKKLEELDRKQLAKLEMLKEEHDKTKEEYKALEDKLPQILIEKGQAEADKVANELNTVNILLEAQKSAISNLENIGCIYYSDEDVIDGYKKYAEDYNAEFDKLHTDYLALFDEAFSLYKQMIELRKNALTVKDNYTNKLIEKALINKVTPLATLDLNDNKSKDTVANFISYYGDPKAYDTLTKTSNDRSIFTKN